MPHPVPFRRLAFPCAFVVAGMLAAGCRRTAGGEDSLSDAATARRLGITVEAVERLRVRRGLTNDVLVRMTEGQLARAIEKADHPKPDHPGEAARWMRLFHEDENGSVPEGALLAAKAQFDALPRAIAPGEDTTWTPLGPGNIGGRCRALLVHPVNAADLLLGSVGGGLWRSTNSGASWAPVNDFLANLAVCSLLRDPLNANTIYAGTGEGFFNIDAIRGAGIFKSTDGGTAWTQLAATANSNFHYVNRLAFSANGATLLAATNTGVWRSTNGGASFTLVFGSRTYDVDFHPTDPLEAVLAYDSSTNGTAWSADGGLSWTTATGFPADANRIETAYAPADGNVVFASVERNSGGSITGGLYRSLDGGATYAAQNTTTTYLGSQGWYDNALWVAPFDAAGAANANTVFVGGLDLWRSTDAGVNFTRISSWSSAPASAHADHHAIVPVPGFNGTTQRGAYFMNDGGAYFVSDVFSVAQLSGWVEKNNQLAVTQFYGASGNAQTGTLVGGTQDNGTLRYTPAGGSEAWTTMFGGDGGFCASDPTNPNYHYGEYVYLRIHRSTNGGTSSSYICGLNGSTWKAAPYKIGDAELQQTAFISPFVLDPNDANRIFAGGRSLWRTDDAKTANTSTTGPSWLAIKAPTTNNSNISAIAVAPGNSNVVWVGHGNGDVWRTADALAAAPAWVQVDAGAPGLPNRMVTRLVVDPQNPQRAWACFAGFNSDNLWRTDTNGATWASYAGLPALPVRDLDLHPGDSDLMFLSTELGVITSANAGAVWSVPNDGPANVTVLESFFLGNDLHAVTHGRGLFRARYDAGFRLEFTTLGGGAGNLHLAVRDHPPAFVEGWTLFSLATTAPAGSGSLFGLTPDYLTLQCLMNPRAPGNFLHFPPPPLPSLYPAAPLDLAPGSLAGFAGITVDAMALLLEALPATTRATSVVRATF